MSKQYVCDFHKFWYGEEALFKDLYRITNCQKGCEIVNWHLSDFDLLDDKLAISKGTLETTYSNRLEDNTRLLGCDLRGIQFIFLVVHWPQCLVFCIYTNAYFTRGHITLEILLQTQWKVIRNNSSHCGNTSQVGIFVTSSDEHGFSSNMER